MRTPTILALLASMVFAAVHTARAETDPEDAAAELVWRWDTPRRLYIETELMLPQPIWFVAEFNKEQRVVAFQVRTVLACEPGEVERKRVREVLCAVEDISLQAAGMPKKEGLLEPILVELDERLSAARVQLQVRTDGRIVNVDLEGLDRRNQRVGDMNENLRIVMSRTLAGLDLQFPRTTQQEGDVWPQYQNWLMQAPSAVGSSGMSEILHKLREHRSDDTYLIESAGRGMIVPGGSANNYDTRMAAFGTFDREKGFLLQRSWSTVGEPTASSAIAEGFAGTKYVQRGRMKLLGDGEAVDVGPTAEVTPPGLTPTTLQVWPPFGTTPNPIPD